MSRDKLLEDIETAVASLKAASAALHASDVIAAEHAAVDAYNRLSKVLRLMETLDLRQGRSVPSSVERWRSGRKF